jgi:hypothetical protein
VETAAQLAPSNGKAPSPASQEPRDWIPDIRAAECSETGRGRRPGTGSAERLQRIEQAVDAMAIEIERISEGQRFTTRLLTSRAESNEPARR